MMRVEPEDFEEEIKISGLSVAVGMLLAFLLGGALGYFCFSDEPIECGDPWNEESPPCEYRGETWGPEEAEINHDYGPKPGSKCIIDKRGGSISVENAVIGGGGITSFDGSPCEVLEDQEEAGTDE